jgi:hypothetical protein
MGTLAASFTAYSKFEADYGFFRRKSRKH